MVHMCCQCCLNTHSEELAFQYLFDHQNSFDFDHNNHFVVLGSGCNPDYCYMCFVVAIVVVGWHFVNTEEQHHLGAWLSILFHVRLFFATNESTIPVP